MSSINIAHLPLSNVPDFVSADTPLMTAWNSINAWYQKIVDSQGEKRTLLSQACFILMACRYINLRIDKMAKEGAVVKLAAGRLMLKMKAVSDALQKEQAIADWLGSKTSWQASVEVGNLLYNALHQQKSQYGATQPLPTGHLIPVQRIWTMISLMIEIAPEPVTVKSKDVKAKLSWLQKQMDESSKRPRGEDDEKEEKSKKAKTMADEVMRRIEVVDYDDLELIKRYDINIGLVPIEGPVKNRSPVTAHDVSTISQGQWLNDVAIDAYLTLVCHVFNGLFQEGVELSKSPRYHAWPVSTNVYLKGKGNAFEERNFEKEWPPARFPNAALEDVSCHIFPIHVPKHWILIVLQKAEDGEWSLFCYSSLSGYDQSFSEPWAVISSWLLFKSKGALNVVTPRVVVPNPQPTQKNSNDCGVFVCGIVRWSLASWDLSTLTPSIIPHFRCRMILELEKWSLSDSSLASI